MPALSVMERYSCAPHGYSRDKCVWPVIFSYSERAFSRLAARAGPDIWLAS